MFLSNNYSSVDINLSNLSWFFFQEKDYRIMFLQCILIKNWLAMLVY